MSRRQELEQITLLEGVAHEVAAVEAELITWVAVHGNLCLALRHPQNTGASSLMVREFVQSLGRWLVERKAITVETLYAAERREGL